MTFTEHPLFVLDDPADLVQVALQMTATGGHKHLGSISDMYDAYLHQHLLLHLTGQDESEVHQRCLDNLNLLEGWFDRGKAAIWS